MQFYCFGDLYILPWTSTSEQIIIEIPNTNNNEYYFPWLKWTLPPVLDWCLTSFKKTLRKKRSAELMQVSCIKRITKHHMFCYLFQHGLKVILLIFDYLLLLKVPLSSYKVGQLKPPGKHTLPEHSQLHFCLIVCDDNDDDNNDDRLDFNDIS